MDVELEIREVDYPVIRPGLVVKVRLDALPELELEGKVSRLGALVDASDASGGKSFRAFVALEDVPPELRPGMTARVDIVTRSSDHAVRVPLRAIHWLRAGSPHVFVTQPQGKAVRRAVVLVSQ